MRIEEPIRKVNCYAAKVEDNGHPVIVEISPAKIIASHAIENGVLLRVYVPRMNPAFSELMRIDSQCLEEVIRSNSDWFHNDLSPEMIKEYFRPALNIQQNTITVLVPNTCNPCISLNGSAQDVIPENLEELDIDMEIEIQGLYFYNTKCGIRWVLRKIVATNACDDDIHPSKEEIDRQWVHDVSVFEKKVVDSCEAYLVYTNRYIDNAKVLVADICASKEMDEAWADKCRKLAKLFEDTKLFAE